LRIRTIDNLLRGGALIYSSQEKHTPQEINKRKNCFGPQSLFV
jgi:hypothetical protein